MPLTCGIYTHNVGVGCGRLEPCLGPHHVLLFFLPYIGFTASSSASLRLFQPSLTHHYVHPYLHDPSACRCSSPHRAHESCTSVLKLSCSCTAHRTKLPAFTAPPHDTPHTTNITSTCLFHDLHARMKQCRRKISMARTTHRNIYMHLKCTHRCNARTGTHTNTRTRAHTHTDTTQAEEGAAPSRCSSSWPA